jgi:hypothetical protein
MARPRKSLKLLEASGAVGKNPQRFRERQVQPDCDQELGPAPQEWIDRAESSNEARALVVAWEEIAASLALVGLGNKADRLAVRAACQLKVRVDRSGFKMAEYNGYRAMLSELGLTERGRANMQRPAPRRDPHDGDFGEFLRKPARRIA